MQRSHAALTSAALQRALPLTTCLHRCPAAPQAQACTRSRGGRHSGRRGSPGAAGSARRSTPLTPTSRRTGGRSPRRLRCCCAGRVGRPPSEGTCAGKCRSAPQSTLTDCQPCPRESGCTNKTEGQVLTLTSQTPNSQTPLKLSNLLSARLAVPHFEGEIARVGRSIHPALDANEGVPVRAGPRIALCARSGHVMIGL